MLSPHVMAGILEEFKQGNYDNLIVFNHENITRNDFLKFIKAIDIEIREIKSVMKENLMYTRDNNDKAIFHNMCVSFIENLTHSKKLITEMPNFRYLISKNSQTKTQRRIGN